MDLIKFYRTGFKRNIFGKGSRRAGTYAHTATFAPGICERLSHTGCNICFESTVYKAKGICPDHIPANSYTTCTRNTFVIIDLYRGVPEVDVLFCVLAIDIILRGVVFGCKLFQVAGI